MGASDCVGDTERYDFAQKPNKQCQLVVGRASDFDISYVLKREFYGQQANTREMRGSTIISITT